MRQSLFFVGALVRFVCRAALRAVITGLLFALCLWAASSYLGVRLPDPYELLKSVTELSRILS